MATDDGRRSDRLNPLGLNTGFNWRVARGLQLRFVWRAAGWQGARTQEVRLRQPRRRRLKLTAEQDRRQSFRLLNAKEGRFDRGLR